jgi:hypothetical protein
MAEYKYPTKLVEYLTEQEADGKEIFTSQIMDGTIWIIPERSMDWITLITWYDGEETFNLVNVTDSGLLRLSKVMKEMNIGETT